MCVCCVCVCVGGYICHLEYSIIIQLKGGREWIIAMAIIIVLKILQPLLLITIIIGSILPSIQAECIMNTWGCSRAVKSIA